jgi:micrococcal nuclease
MEIHATHIRDPQNIFKYGGNRDRYKKRKLRAKSFSLIMATIRARSGRSLLRITCTLFLVYFAIVLLAHARQFLKVKQVVDGDTIVTETGERIRLIGVDTPENGYASKKPTERFGKEAAEFTRRMVEGKRVRLEYDQANAVRGYTDTTPQKRILAYVFLEDGTLLNAEIIRQGYGYALSKYPFARMEEFRRLEREARENRRGVWATSP